MCFSFSFSHRFPSDCQSDGVENVRAAALEESECMYTQNTQKEETKLFTSDIDSPRIKIYAFKKGRMYRSALKFRSACRCSRKETRKKANRRVSEDF